MPMSLLLILHCLLAMSICASSKKKKKKSLPKILSGYNNLTFLKGNFATENSHVKAYFRRQSSFLFVVIENNALCLCNWYRNDGGMRLKNVYLFANVHVQM